MPDSKKQILNRLRTLQGHIGGVIAMIEEDQDCQDILLQMKAISASVSKVRGVIFEHHLDHCLKLSEQDQAKVREVLKMIV